MYPFIRLIKDVLMARRLPALENFSDVHVSHHICWPWDVDMFAEIIMGGNGGGEGYDGAEAVAQMLSNTGKTEACQETMTP